jgi:hypothetical protein
MRTAIVVKLCLLKLNLSSIHHVSEHASLLSPGSRWRVKSFFIPGGLALFRIAQAACLT